MRRAALFLSAAVLMFSAATLSAQAPNFAGHWTMVVNPNAAPTGRGGGGLGADVTITQDAKTLTTTRTTQNGPVATVYNLDGSDSKNTVQGRNGAMDVISHAKWDGAKLVISTTRNMGGNDVTTTMTLSVDGDGNLVVQNTRPGQDGSPTTTTSTYKKS